VDEFQFHGLHRFVLILHHDRSPDNRDYAISLFSSYFILFRRPIWPLSETVRTLIEHSQPPRKAIMEKTRKIHSYLIALFLMLAVGTANAQQTPAGFGQQGEGAPFMHLFDELGLDEYQAEEIQAIFEEARAMHNEERAIAFANREAIRAGTHEAVMEMLNDEQRARFEELSELRNERWGGGDRQNNGRRGQSADRPNGDCTNPDCTDGDCTNPDCPNDGIPPNDGSQGGGG
jgi:hypothetical protein